MGRRDKEVPTRRRPRLQFGLFTTPVSSLDIHDNTPTHAPAEVQHSHEASQLSSTMQVQTQQIPVAAIPPPQPAVVYPPWSAHLDANTGLYYYWNMETNEVTWTPPVQQPPPPVAVVTPSIPTAPSTIQPESKKEIKIQIKPLVGSNDDEPEAKRRKVATGGVVVSTKSEINLLGAAYSSDSEDEITDTSVQAGDAKMPSSETATASSEVPPPSTTEQTQPIKADIDADMEEFERFINSVEGEGDVDMTGETVDAAGGATTQVPEQSAAVVSTRAPSVASLDESTFEVQKPDVIEPLPKDPTDEAIMKFMRGVSHLILDDEVLEAIAPLTYEPPPDIPSDVPPVQKPVFPKPSISFKLTTKTLASLNKALVDEDVEHDRESLGSQATEDNNRPEERQQEEAPKPPEPPAVQTNWNTIVAQPVTEKKPEPGEIELQKQIDEISSVLLSKLELLGISVPVMTNFESMRFELRLRLQDMAQGGLPRKYVLSKLRDYIDEFQRYESSAAPAGWRCLWDKQVKRYYYENVTTNALSWDYPEVDESPGQAATPAAAGAVESGPIERVFEGIHPARLAMIQQKHRGERAMSPARTAQHVKEETASPTPVLAQTKTAKPKAKPAAKPLTLKGKKADSLMERWSTVQKEDQTRTARAESSDEEDTGSQWYQRTTSYSDWRTRNR
eukprot:Colp12_sorted_trinity150504_noHs@11910